MFEATSIVGGVTALCRTIGHIAELAQTTDEVDAATAEINACQKRLSELTELRSNHAALLAKSPDEEARTDTIIKTAWKDLQKAKEVLEPSRIIKREASGNGGPASELGIGRRIKWRFYKHDTYKHCELAVKLNNKEVRDQIRRLEEMARFDPLEAIVSGRNKEDRRRQEELERARDERDMKGLEYLQPVVRGVKNMEDAHEDAVSEGGSGFFT